jgi:hypothetical protein
MKNSLDGLKNRLGLEEEKKISELKDRTIEMIKI